MDLRIELSSPTGVFLPGTDVVGVVLIESGESVRARKISVRVDGRAQTRWKAKHRELVHHHATGKDKYETHERNFGATVVYASGENVIWSSGGSDAATLPKGRHQFPFSFRLPPNCAPSFEGNYGFIRYHCRVVVDRPWRFDSTATKYFSVVPPVDLNLAPQLSQAISIEAAKDFGVLVFRHGVCHLNMALAQRGFVSGEPIGIDALVENRSSRELRQARIAIAQRAYFIGLPHLGTCCTMDHGHFLGLNGRETSEQRYEKRTVVDKCLDIDVQPGVKKSLHFMVQLPATVPSFSSCPIIRVVYTLKLVLIAKGHVGNELEAKTEITVGTIPIRRAQAFQQPLPVSPPTIPIMPLGFDGVADPAASWKPIPPPRDQPSPVNVVGFAPAFPSTSSSSNGPPASAPSAPPIEVSGPPPSYEEATTGRAALADQDSSGAAGNGNSEKSGGAFTTPAWAPLYPVYHFDVPGTNNGS